MPKNVRSEIKIATINIGENVVDICNSLQNKSPFKSYTKDACIDLSRIADLTRVSLAYFHKHPPTIDQLKELRRVTTNDSLFFELEDILEEK